MCKTYSFNFIPVVKFSFDTQEKDKDSTDFAIQQFQKFVDNAENTSGISLSRDLRLKNVEEVIPEAVRILQTRFKIVDAQTCLGLSEKPFYQHDFEGRDEGEIVPKLKEDWSKPELTCQQHLRA